MHLPHYDLDVPEKRSSDKNANIYPAEEHNIERGDIEDLPRDQLKRHLGNRQVQLIAIGDSIGTATFVSIGTSLQRSGPGNLLIAYTLYTCMLGLVNNCMAEMATMMPVTGAFIRMSGKWVDESLGFMVG
jgi:yeast amino acid transporter